jgi:succinate dehydrogenase/fumarate reductase flavoprotein subunit
MGAEVGAELSGMEFSSYYTVAPARSTMTRSMSYAFACYFDADGHPLEIAPGPDVTRALAAALLKGPVMCSLERTPHDIREVMPQVQPNFMLPFARWGVDPYTQTFEITLRGEGTVRGVGGLRIADEDCGVGVPGLFAAGDVASRELVAGATSGGGAQNSAWALSSGHWAGGAAARFARRLPAFRAQEGMALGRAGIRPLKRENRLDLVAAQSAVKAEMLPYDKNVFRSGVKLSRSLEVLEELWREVRDNAGGPSADLVGSRETAALIAAGRWCYTAALARSESRGMHQRTDAPLTDPRLARRLRLRGLDHVLIHPDTNRRPAEATA